MAKLNPQSHADEFIYALAAYGNEVLAASTSGLYRSIDAGETWQPATASLGLNEEVPSTAVVFSPEYSEDHTIVAGMAGGILRSGDGAATWVLGITPPPPPTITALVISPAFREDGILLAGTMDDGVLRSADRGYRWASWNFGLLDLSIFSLAISPDFARDETVFAGTESGIFRSTNGGRAWREVDLPIGYETVLSLGISPHFGKDGTLFAGTETQGLLRSTDGGVTWQKVGGNALEGPVNSVIVSPVFSQHKDVAVLCNGEIYLSRNGGDTWQPLRPELLEEGEVTALLAPQGFSENAPVWVGIVGGEVKRFTLP